MAPFGVEEDGEIMGMLSATDIFKAKMDKKVLKQNYNIEIFSNLIPIIYTNF